MTDFSEWATVGISMRFCDCYYCFKRMNKKKEIQTHTCTLYYMGVSRNLVRGLLFHIKVQAFPLPFQAICVCSMPTKYIANSIGCSLGKLPQKKKEVRGVWCENHEHCMSHIPDREKKIHTHGLCARMQSIIFASKWSSN